MPTTFCDVFLPGNRSNFAPILLPLLIAELDRESLLRFSRINRVCRASAWRFMGRKNRRWISARTGLLSRGRKIDTPSLEEDLENDREKNRREIAQIAVFSTLDKRNAFIDNGLEFSFRFESSDRFDLTGGEARAIDPDGGRLIGVTDEVIVHEGIQGTVYGYQSSLTIFDRSNGDLIRAGKDLTPIPPVHFPKELRFFVGGDKVIGGNGSGKLRSWRLLNSSLIGVYDRDLSDLNKVELVLTVESVEFYELDRIVFEGGWIAVPLKNADFVLHQIDTKERTKLTHFEQIFGLLLKSERHRGQRFIGLTKRIHENGKEIQIYDRESEETVTFFAAKREKVEISQDLGLAFFSGCFARLKVYDLWNRQMYAFGIASEERYVAMEITKNEDEIRLWDVENDTDGFPTRVSYPSYVLS